jgi:hypothetical protein
MWTSEIPAFFWRPKVRGAEQDKAEGVGLFQSGQYFKSYQVRGPRRAPERSSEIGELSNKELEHQTWQLLVKKRGNFGKGSTFLMGTSPRPTLPTHGGFNWHVTSPEGKQLMGKHSKSGFKQSLQNHPKTWMVKCVGSEVRRHLQNCIMEVPCVQRWWRNCPINI